MTIREAITKALNNRCAGDLGELIPNEDNLIDALVGFDPEGASSDPCAALEYIIDLLTDAGEILEAN
jgi:hypothetical protein